MGLRLSRAFSFEAGHRLAKGYTGKCKNIHGHSWHGEVTIDTNYLDSMDMSVDFGVLKDICNRIEDAFDHKLILCSEDKHIIDFCKEHNYEIVIIEEANPTCEVLAKLIDSIVKSEISKYKMTLTDVTDRHYFDTLISIKETSNSNCGYEQDKG